MREYKFRAWDKKLHEIVKDPYVEAHFTYAHLNELLASTKDRYELMQYTGLKDKNGEEIYEGDVVRQTVDKVWGYDEEGEPRYSMSNYAVIMVGEVMISTRQGVVMRKAHIIESGKEEWKGRILRYKNVTRSRCEVIGNIYENPELLTEQS